MHEFLLPVGLLDADPPYWFAVIASRSPLPASYDGPPHGDPPEGPTRVLVLEPGPGVDAFLSRYGATLGFQGDSYFESREAAVAAVEEEFEGVPLEWQPVPATVVDAERYALQAACRIAAPGDSAGAA